MVQQGLTLPVEPYGRQTLHFCQEPLLPLQSQGRDVGCRSSNSRTLSRDDGLGVSERVVHGTRTEESKKVERTVERVYDYLFEGLKS